MAILRVIQVFLAMVGTAASVQALATALEDMVVMDLVSMCTTMAHHHKIRTIRTTKGKTRTINKGIKTSD